MCKWGDLVPVRLHEPDNSGSKIANVDRCIAPLVQALQDVGIKTVGSCCGHGKRAGNIALSDGRFLVVMPDHETWERFEMHHALPLWDGWKEGGDARAVV